MNDIGSLQSDILELTIIGLKYEMGVVKVSEYDQEIPQSHTADQPTAPWGRAKNIYSNNTPVRQ